MPKVSAIPKVSIITVCFNSAETIQDTINSVLSQDYPSIEYIIVDGGSKDGTLEIIRQYKGQIARVISEPDRGIYDAMNKGIQIATGDSVCMLNSDDVYTTKKSLRHLVEHMCSAGTDTVFADLVIVDPKNIERVLRYYDSSRFHPKKLRYGWMPPHCTFLVKRQIMEKWGGYSLDYQISSDFEMIVRLFCKGKVSYAYLPEIIVKMRTGGVSTRGFRNRWILNKEIVSACRANGLNTSLFRLFLKIPVKMMEYFKKPNLG